MDIKKIEKYIDKNHRKKKWLINVTVLGIIASMVTNALLTNPADAMAGALICSQEEHTHTDECYITMPVHVACAENTQEQHLHDQTCYDAEGYLVCGKEEYVIIHTHDSNCYDKDGNLICSMPEVQDHIHDASCYDAEGNLICGIREIKEHTHTEECWTVNEAGESVLKCTYPTAITHQHAMACYDQVEAVLNCGKEEHVHTDSCYEQKEETVSEEVQTETIEENTEETAAEAAEVPEEVENTEKTPQMPAVSFENADTEVIVTVTAEEGSFPEGTEMRVVPVAAEEVTDAVQSTTEKSVVEIQAVDISFWYQEEEIEPLKPINVVMKPKAVTAEADHTAVVHVKDEGETEVVVEETEGVQEEVVFDTPEFSVYAIVYTVDFHYEVNGNTYDYSIKGGTGISLRELLTALNVVNEEESYTFVSEITDVTFSNPELVDVYQIMEDITVQGIRDTFGIVSEYAGDLTEEEINENNNKVIPAGDWALLSKVPFDTEETMTITMMDGAVFKVKVTDAQIKKTVIDAKGDTWEITVTYGEDAKIPDGAELKVEEILPEDEEYVDLYNRSIEVGANTAEKQGVELPVICGTRMFDIEIHGDDGEIEPAAPVQVNIRLVGSKQETEKLSVVHFADDGAEALNNREVGTADRDSYEVAFEAESFSVYTVQNFTSLSDYLNSAEYALVSERGTGITSADGINSVSNFAMISSMNGDSLSGKGVYMDKTATPRTVGGYVTEWGFENAGNNQYYIYMMDGNTKKYVKASGNNLVMDTTGTPFTATVSDNKVRFSYNRQSITSTGDNPSSFVLANNSGNESLFNLCEVDPDYEEKTAKKVSAADWKSGNDETEWNENDTVVIYRRIEHEDGSEDLYVLATDGTLIPAYDGGDSIYYHCPEDKNVNWHVVLGASGYYISNVVPEGSSESTVYLVPSVTNGTWSSESPVGLVLGGMSNTYGTTIENWDQAAYAYAGLHVDATNANTLAQGITVGSGDTSDTFMFAVADTLITEGTLHTVDTVDSTSKGITMKIFNYSGPVYNFGYRNAAMQAVMGDAMLSDWDNRKSHVTKTVEAKLGDDGYPVSLTDGYGSYAKLFTDGAVINYPAYSHPQGWEDGYEAGSTTVTGRDANHLFLQTYYDEDGMFRYSSMENFAHFNTTKDTVNNIEAGNFTVYREAGTPNYPTADDHYYYYHGHFMPYNTLDPTVSISRIVDQYGSITDKDMGRSFEDVYGLKETPDYYVGMTLEAKFVQPSGGTLENGDPVVFRFTGDDDMLVYIDGILVLDVGGIHEPLTGSINFETGTVYQPNFYNEGAGWQNHTTTLYKIFRNAYNNGLISDEDWSKMKWVDADSNGEYDTFADHTTHKFNMFYLERGAGASNLDLQFNLQVTKKDEFTVRKKLPEDVKPEFVNQLYRFRAMYKDGSGNMQPLYPPVRDDQGTVVREAPKNNEDDYICDKVIYANRTDATGRPIEVPVSVDEQGYFYLRAGEAAVFTVPDETIIYDVYEVDIDGNLINKVDVNGVSTQIDAQNGPSEVNAGADTVENRSEVNVTNHPITQNLRVTKHITDDSLSGWEEDKPVFEFRVYLEQFVTDDDGNIVYEDVVDDVTGDTIQKPKTKLVPYSRSPYYLVKIPEGEENNEAAWEYYTLTGENNAPVLQPHGTVCSITGRSGTINSIPPEYTIIIPDLAVGTHFYVEERRVTIPEGYEFDHETLKEGTYDPSTLGASKENIAQIMTIDQYSNNEQMYFDAASVGRIMRGTDEERKDAEFDVWNRKPAIEIPVEKIWVGGDSNNRPDVTLALIRYMPQDKYTPPVGQGAILIEHVADYGETNTSTTLPSGFVATYAVEKFNTETNEYEVIATGTSGPFDVDPGTYRVSTVVNNRGNEPTNYTYSKTDPVMVTVDANQSTVAHVISEYNYEQGGQITIAHDATYEGGELTGTDLPEGISVTYTIKDANTNRIVHRNVPAGTYDVPAGTYTVTANVSDPAAPTNYVYQDTTSDDDVTVASGGSATAELTSTYVYVEPKSYGYITLSHVSSGLTGTSPALPQNFQVTSYRIVGPTTINNAQLGQEYEVEAGEYTVIANVNYAPVIDGYVYAGTPDQEVVVGTDAHESVTLTSVYGRQGAIHIVHTSTGMSGTNAIPGDMSVQYTIVNNVTGETLRSNVSAGTYNVPAGEYTVTPTVNYEGTAPDGYFYLGTDPVTVTVLSEETADANVVSRYGANGTISIVHQSSGLAGSPTELPSTFQVRYLIKDSSGNVVNSSNPGTGPHSVAPGTYTVIAHIDYQEPPTGYTYIDDGDNEDSATVTVASGEDITATVVSSYIPPQNLVYTLTGTWKDKNGNTLPESEWPTSGSVTVPILDDWSAQVGTFTLNPDNNWTGTASLISGGGHGHYKLDTDNKTINGTGIDSVSFNVTSLSDTEAGSFTYTGVVKPNTATVYLCIDYSQNMNGSSCEVQKGSSAKLVYSNASVNHGSWTEPITPTWKLCGWNGNSWNDVAGQNGSAPGPNGVAIPISGDYDIYCIFISTAPGNAQYINASIEPVVSTTSNSVMQSYTASAAPASTMRSAVPFSPRFTVRAASGTRSAPAESTVSPSSLVIPDSIANTIIALNQNLAGNSAGYEYSLDTSFGKQVVLSDPWSYTFDDLEELGEGGHPYYYALIEVEVPEDYEVSYLNNPVNASDIKENMDERAAAERYNEEHPDEPVEVPALLTLSAVNTSTNTVTGSVKVTKSFSGISSLPSGFKLTASYNDGTADRIVELTTATVGMTGTGTSGDPYTWTIDNLPIGTVVSFEESGFDENGYTVLINGETTASSKTATAAETPGTASFVNEYTRNPGGLELTKKVSGTGADQTKEFVFTIELTAPTGTTLAETYPVLKTGEGETSLTLDRTDGNTKASITVSLKHNQSWEIKNLPVETGYTITETDYSGDGYTQSITKGIATGIVSGGTVTKEEVEFTNTYSAVDVTVIKIDESTRNAEHPENQTTLSGAKFKLYRYSVPVGGSTGTYTVYPDDTNSEKTTSGTEGESYGTLTFESLPDGCYMISETEPPAGYVKTQNNDIYFDIVNGVITRYDKGYAEISRAEISEETNTVNITYSKSEKTFTVGNNPGAALPNTGGPGTRLFTILGSILILGAGALLWRRRRFI